MEPEAPSHSQEPPNCRYPEPDQFHFTINVLRYSLKVVIILVTL
jgi:hypothetical protein